jgi:hypothetical protein
MKVWNIGGQEWMDTKYVNKAKLHGKQFVEADNSMMSSQSEWKSPNKGRQRDKNKVRTVTAQPSQQHHPLPSSTKVTSPPSPSSTKVTQSSPLPHPSPSSTPVTPSQVQQTPPTKQPSPIPAMSPSKMVALGKI